MRQAALDELGYVWGEYGQNLVSDNFVKKIVYIIIFLVNLFVFSLNITCSLTELYVGAI